MAVNKENDEMLYALLRAAMEGRTFENALTNVAVAVQGGDATVVARGVLRGQG